MLSAVYATPIPYVCLSHAYLVSKRSNASSKILSLSDRCIIVFQYQGLLRKSDGFSHNFGAEYKGQRFSTNIDGGIVTMEDEYKVVCALSNGAVFDDVE